MAVWSGTAGDDTRSAYSMGESSEHVQYQGADGDDSLDGGYLGDYLDGGEGADTLYGGDGGDSMITGNGDDYATGGGGDDYFSFGKGDQTLFGDAGDDTFSSIEANAGFTVFMNGGAGDDVFFMSLGKDVIVGGAGEDLLDYSQMTTGVTVNLYTNTAGGAAAGDSFRLVEDVKGTSFADVIVGDGARNVIESGFGADRVVGGAGGDYLDGGAGVDTLDYVGSDAGVIVDLAKGAASGGDAQGDNIFSFERIRGSAYRDALFGSDEANGLWGQAGDDSLAGKAGADALYGVDGADKLLGGLGADRLTGGLGADRFIFATGDSTSASRDTIVDFSRPQGDKIDVSLIDANTGAAGDQGFAFIGAQAFHGVSGELRYLISGGAGFIVGDVNGDKVADLAIAATGVTSFVQGDFIL